MCEEIKYDGKQHRDFQKQLRGSQDQNKLHLCFWTVFTTHLSTHKHTHSCAVCSALMNLSKMRPRQAVCSGGWQPPLQITDHFPSIVHFLPSSCWLSFSLCVFTANERLLLCYKQHPNTPSPPFSPLPFLHTCRHLFIFLYLSLTSFSFSRYHIRPLLCCTQGARRVRCAVKRDWEYVSVQREGERKGGLEVLCRHRHTNNTDMHVEPADVTEEMWKKRKAEVKRK